MATISTSTAATAQLAMNAAMLPAAQAVQTALDAAQTAVASAQAIVTGCSACRTVNLVNNVDGMISSYAVEASACIAELSPPAAAPATS